MLKKYHLFTITMIFCYMTQTFAATTYVCLSQGENLRQWKGKRYPVNSRIQFTIDEEETPVVLTDVTGFLHTSGKVRDSFAKGYQALFHTSSIKENVDYAPIIYNSHSQFYLESTYNNYFTRDDNLAGQFVINKKRPENIGESFDAHLLFQMGRSMGGTVDYVCQIAD